MINVGIIGFGSMGRMLAEGLLSSGVICPSRLYMATRTPEKTYEFKIKFDQVKICETNGRVGEACGMIFICVPPTQVKNVLLDIRDSIDESTHIISFASCVSIANIESIVNGRISKVIPSFVSEVKEGVFLTCHNERVTYLDTENLKKFLNTMGTIKEIREDQFEIYTELTSCSPGILSAVFSEFIRSATRHGSIDENEAKDMFVQTLYGLAKLYREKNLDFDETISRVARKGGMTEIGATAVRNRLPSLFDSIFEQTLARYELKKRDFDSDYQSPDDLVQDYPFKFIP